MDFGKFDIVLLTTMSMAIIFMSIIFPAVGLAPQSEEQGANDIPEFNVSSSQWDIAGEFPDRPGTPNSGTVKYDEQRGSSITGESLIWIKRPTANGVSLETQNLSNQLTLRVNNWSNTNLEGQDEYNINSEGQQIYHENTTNGWTIDFEVRTLENAQEPDMYAEIDYEIVESPPENEGFLDSIPIVSGFIDAGEAVAGTLGWLGLIIRWFFVTLFEVVLTLVTILVTVMVFSVDIMVWLMTTYFGVVDAAGGFASVVLMIPGVLLFGEFAKLGMLGIKLLPTT